jgi:hypothetical protein
VKAGETGRRANERRRYDASKQSAKPPKTTRERLTVQRQGTPQGKHFFTTTANMLHSTTKENTMELEIYEAFQAAGIPNDKAKSAVDAINKAIDQRYNLHSKQLVTQGDVEKVRAEVEKVRIEIANAKVEIIKWNIGAIVAAVGLFAAIAKITGT